MPVNKKKLIVVAGPTAVGKSKYGIEIAKKVNGEIVSLDSMQVYKGFDIGTAKITKNEMENIPHHMIDVVSADRNLNIKEFKDMAELCIDTIYSRGKIPVLVGGTGFYIRAMLYDTDFLEEDEEKQSFIREKLYDELDKNGIKALYNKLKDVDPKSAEKIPIGNERRLIRALEFYEMHNFPISEHNDTEMAKESRYDYDFYVLTMDREKLYDRINKRVDKMIADGLLLEIKKLIESGVSRESNAMKSIGYRELYDFVNNNDINNLGEKQEIELKKIIEEIKMHTRNYAKRQFTWFRSQKNVTWVQM